MKFNQTRASLLFLLFYIVLLPTLSSCRNNRTADILTVEERVWLEKHNGTIRLGPDPNAPPLDFFDNKDEYQGLTADYVRLIEKKLNFKFQIIKANSWNELLDMGKKKEVDVICAAKRTPERNEYLLFTSPFIQIPNVIITRKKVDSDLSMSDLRGKKVTMVAGYAVMELISKEYPWLNIVPCSNDLDGLLKVSFGEVDAMIIDLTMASHLIEKEHISNLRVAGNSGVVIDLGFASRNDWPVLNRILEKGLSLITEKERKEVFAKWIHLEDQPFLVTKNFWINLFIIFIAVSVIFSLVLLWNTITERKKARNALKTFRDALENSTDAIGMSTPEGHHYYQNKAFDKLFGKIGQYPPDTVYVDKKVGEEVFKTIISGGTWTGEVKMYAEDGRILDVYLRAYANKDQYGNIISLVGVHTDITERKQAEANMRDAKIFLENIFRTSLEGIIVSDSGGTITMLNDTAEKLFGYTRDELIGSHVTVLGSTAEQDRAHGRDILERLFENGNVTCVEDTWIKKDGSPIWIEMNMNILKDDDGNFTSVVSSVRDITARKKAEKEKTRLQAQLIRAEKMETVGILAGGVAHDLNNILGAIVGYPDLILLDIPQDSPLRGSVLAIKESGERAREIVQDMLTLARRGIYIAEVENLNNVITGYLGSPEFFKLKELHPEVHVETNLAAGLLNILGSKIHISKAVMNLVANAAEAMPAGGKIAVSTENAYLDKPLRGYDKIQEGEYAVLTISDEGIGISDNDLKRIFEPFYTKKVMGRSGSGLGMSVIWGTVKDHRGYIDVESEEGTGTSFKLYFPVTRKEKADSENSFRIEKFVGNGETILVVDDVKAQREIASSMLTKLNYTVTSVASGEEAVEYLKNNAADLLILDMIMSPGIDGLETYKRILETQPAQKAIIASGFSETEAVKEAQGLGAGTYIKKPYTLEKIGLSVKGELNKQTAGQ